MRIKPDDDDGVIPAPGSSVIRDFLAALAAGELERVATAVIREHRVRLQQAQDLFEQIDRREAAGAPDDEIEELRHNYTLAMLNLHAQHELVSRVIEALGHVPVVDGLRPVLN